jgi:hypothetical protein
MRTVRFALVPALAAAGLLVTPVAWADGDPASDVLIGQDAFVSYVVAPKLARQITAAVAAANKSGYRVKVAMIATRTDLGLVQGLWQKPETYARFLGSELRFFYKGRLVIEMPNGFGVSAIKGDVSRERRILAGTKPATGSEGMAQSLLEALRKLAPASAVAGKSGSDLYDRVLIGVGAAVLLVALVLGGRYVQRQRRSAELRPEE